MPEIRIALGERSYSVYVGDGILDRSRELLAAAGLADRPLFIVTDENVVAAQAPALRKLKESAGGRSDLVTVASGEDSKSMAAFASLLDQLAAFEDGAGAAVVAVGGGVIGDLGGFVAACYKRGVPWIQVPTTLLSQVDASVGGKTAINHPSAKNLIGAFHQPRLVIADMSLLRTLPARELRSGLAEVIKHGVIADAALFERIEGNIDRALRLDGATLEDYVSASCVIKGAVVEADERDTTGQRAFLNYGHTFGHAIELAAHFRYAHGEAVAIGMACAGDMAVRIGMLDQQAADRIETIIGRAGLPVRAEGVSLGDVMAAMRLDKKFQHGQNRFVLARRIGEVELVRNVPEDLIVSTVRARLEG